MASGRKVACKFISTHLVEWFKALEVNNEQALNKRCKQILGESRKLTKTKFEEFRECIDKVSQPTWENFLRRCRDKEYEKNRGRVTVKKTTVAKLDELRDELRLDSNDALILKLIEAYQTSEPAEVQKPSQKPKKKTSLSSRSNNKRQKITPEEGLNFVFDELD
ncbi:hypothetical protein AAEH92_15940 [Shewanella xiamenensis]|uniref:hypothetical protein n=1 Tax=Shewanella xiamenensis TaxID=332186 RepID=UPI00313B48A1